MKLLIKIFITAILVLFIANFLPGVHVAGFSTALLVAVVLGILNIFIKPLLVLFTLPVTILTLGLFLFVINALIILLITEIVGGFRVDSFFTALIFSVVLSVLQSILNAIIGGNK